MEFALIYFRTSKLLSSIKTHKSNIYKALKYVIMILAYAYVSYKLISFNNYPDFTSYWKAISINNILFLLLVFLLLPINWLIEAFKWKKIVSKSQKLSLTNAYKSVLAGCSTGFFTPNRVGDMAGRLIFLSPKNRKVGISYFIVNSLTQNIAIVLIGLPLAILYFLNIKIEFSSHSVYYFASLIIFLIVLVSLLFLLPQIAKSIKLVNLQTYIQAFTEFKKNDFAKIISFSAFRFVVFCVQFYAMLLFTGTVLNIWQAVFVIPTYYLFITFTPSFAFSEPAIRSSYAILFISAFVNQSPSIAFAGFALWLINYAFPMLIGAVFLVKNKSI